MVGVGVGIGLGFRLLQSGKRFREVAGTPVAEQDDGNVKQERGEQGVGGWIADCGADCTRYDLGAQNDEQQDGGQGGARRDQVACGHPVRGFRFASWATCHCYPRDELP